MWDILDTYWDKDEKSLYIDVSRNFTFQPSNADLNPNNAITLPTDEKMVWFMNYGVFPSALDANSKYIIGDKSDTPQYLTLLKGAKRLYASLLMSVAIISYA